MALWIIMAALTAAASIAVLAPVFRDRAGRTAGAEEVSIYRDQLEEIDRDLARGLIADSEAEAARTEIARRLLRADAAAGAAGPSDRTASRRVALVVALVVMPVTALAFYLYVGNPTLPDRPLAARLSAPAEEQDMAVLIARVEAHLAANPEDGRGWELLGPVYVRLGRYDDAVAAFSNASRILGPTAAREADIGEAIVRANGNVVTAEAQAAFERARDLDPEAVRPRFYLALALDQEGRREEAILAWRQLLDGAPADAPWAEVARQALARLGDTPPAMMPGPSAEDVQAAGALSEEERMTMIGGMVASLAARLEQNPEDPEGWARLVRSYMVLGRRDEAETALQQARQTFGSDSDELAIVETEARSVGLIE